jgi:hypothetical protein
MNCGLFEEKLMTWLAADEGPLDPALEAPLAEHLEACADCQALVAGVTGDDALLRRALREPAAAERVARGAWEQVKRLQTPPLPARISAWVLPVVSLLSLAAGFLLAWMLLPPGAPSDNPTQPAIAQVVPIPATPVAHLVSATGDVEHFDEQQQNWIPVDTKLGMFACPTDSRLRTKPNVQCELTTQDGCVIRLNDETEVTLLGSSAVELRQGQLWCKSPSTTQLEVHVAGKGAASSPGVTGSKPTLVCIGASCFLTGIEDSGNVQVVNASGDIKVRTPTHQQDLNPGQMAEISNGQVITELRRVDPLLATRWMQPLLIKQGPNSAELRERVDALLAEVGRSKIATLYEQEIRALGEHGVLPLVRYIQSPLAADQPLRRQTAMQLVVDLAPIWLIPDLIDLLSDREAYVRQGAATALRRLTAIDMNLSPEEWGEAPDEIRQQAIREWRNWWAQHRAEFPTHELRVTEE